MRRLAYGLALALLVVDSRPNGRDWALGVLAALLAVVGITFLSLGVWIGDPAMRWLVQELTHSPFWVGVIGFCSSFPILVFSLPGGVLADRVNRVLLFSLGRGTGALLTLLLATGVTGLQLAGAPTYVTQLFNGAALIIAMALAARTARRRG